MSDADRVAAFLKLADEELEAGRVLHQALPRQAAYLVQQAAEKATRALLTQAGITFGTGHNLGQMAAALASDHPQRNAAASLDRLSPAATRHRYPSPAGHLGPLPPPSAVSADIDEVAAFVRAAKTYLSG